MDAKETSMLIGRISVKCQACEKEEGTEKHRLHHCPEWYEVRREIQKFSGSWSKKQEPQRRSGNGKEESSRTLSVEVNGTGAVSV